MKAVSFVNDAVRAPGYQTNGRVVIASQKRGESRHLEGGKRRRAAVFTLHPSSALWVGVGIGADG